MYTLSNTPQEGVKVLTNGFTLYKASLWQVLPFSFAATLLIFSSFIGLSFLDPIQGATIDLLINASIIFYIIFVWLIAFLMMSAIIFRQHCIVHRIQNSLAATLGFSLNNFIPLVLLAILYCIVVFCGTILLILPGIVLAFSLMFCFLLRITDHTPVLQALIQSHRLIWGNWWHASILVSIPLMINLAITQIVFIAMLYLFSQYPTISQHTYFFTLLTNAFLQAILHPLVFAVALMVMHDLKLRKRFSW